MEFKINDVVQMKKPHACGKNEWVISRIGADFKIKCLNCGHEVMLSRSKFERAFKTGVGERGEKITQ